MAFVIREGSITGAVNPVGAPLMSMNFAQEQLMERQTYGWIYSHQPNIHTVVSFLARNIAQLKLKTYQRVNDTDRRELSDHPLAVLLMNPNPYTTPYRLIYGIVADRAIYDAAYLMKMRTETGGIGLVRMPPERMSVSGSNWLAPTSFILHTDDGEKEIPAEHIVYFRGYNPDNNRNGVSPIASLRDYLMEEYNANRWRGQMWKNSARVSGYIERPVDAPHWKGPDKERFRQMWRSQYVGEGPQAGGTPVLEDGMRFVPASINPKEAQYIESRKLTREECANAYHIPPPMVGILDNASFSNITEQHKMLYQDTLGPWLSDIEQEVRLQLLPDFESGTKARKIYVEFNIQEKLDGSFTEQSESLSTAVGSPWMTPNEGRARMNLPSLPGGDDLVVPLNVTKGGQASPQDGGDPVAREEPVSEEPKRSRVFTKARPSEQDVRALSDDLAKFFARQKQVILSQYGAGKGKFDEDRWNRELAKVLYDHGLVSTKSAGEDTVKRLGLAAYSAERTEAWLQAHAEGAAAGVNAVTALAILAVLSDEEDSDIDVIKASIAGLFDDYARDRAPDIAHTETQTLHNFGMIEAVEQNGKSREAKKRWVTGPNPRGAHAALDGVEVAIDGKFNVGGFPARWPGDTTLPVEERAQCNCEIEIVLPGDEDESE